jgi:hypothetical protein
MLHSRNLISRKRRLRRIRESQRTQLLEVRFRATLGQEPEIELMLV